VIGNLASTYKLGADSGTMFGVTDTNEGWWVEVTQDGQWVAEKVKSNTASVRANIFRIGEVNFGSENFKYSDDLVSYAESKGWHDGSEPFDFAKAYADPDKVDSEYNTLREKRVETILAPYVTAQTVNPKVIMSIFRDHYEGTEFDLTYGHRQGSPHQTDKRTLCRIDTEVSTVIQSRAQIEGQDVPADIGAICWRALATPCTSIYTPWYLGSLQVPKEYRSGVSQFTKNSAYWASRNLSKSVDIRYGDVVVKEVKRVRDDFENKGFDSQQKREHEALELYKKDPDKARAYLTKYSTSMAIKAMAKMNSLYEYSERH
jgi:dipeptidase